MHFSLMDFVILAVVIVLIYSGKGIAELGRKLGEALSRFKGGGPGGPKAA